MIESNVRAVADLVLTHLGGERGRTILDMLAIDPDIGSQAHLVHRSTFAMALNVILFEDLLERVPSGADYVAWRIASGNRILFDHGALRTIRLADGPTGRLPQGISAFTRILEPLGYRQANVYPLTALCMTGYAYRQVDFPKTIPQFFVSELHVEQFGAEFQVAARRVFGTSEDPLDAHAVAALTAFAADDHVDRALAIAALPTIVAAFDRHHAEPMLADYDVLLRESREAAWIATEGNAFNHATDRVDNVAELAETLRSSGMAMKERIELSASGRVRQTALRADVVSRPFIDADGRHIERSVPGSFFEFISRDVDPATGDLDLGFDSSNAQGIFAMTRTA